MVEAKQVYIEAKQVYETVLYASDLEAAAEFYVEVIGLKLLSQTELMLVLRVGVGYLLIFDPEKSSQSGRLVPSHGSKGQGHFAFTTDENEQSLWRQKLEKHGIEIESEVEWDSGKRGRSIYIRDPAGNSVEFAPPILWNYLHE